MQKSGPAYVSTPLANLIQPIQREIGQLTTTIEPHVHRIHQELQNNHDQLLMAHTTFQSLEEKQKEWEHKIQQARQHVGTAQQKIQTVEAQLQSAKQKKDNLQYDPKAVAYEIQKGETARQQAIDEYQKSVRQLNQSVREATTTQAATTVSHDMLKRTQKDYLETRAQWDEQANRLFALHQAQQQLAQGKDQQTVLKELRHNYEQKTAETHQLQTQMKNLTQSHTEQLAAQESERTHQLELTKKHMQEKLQWLETQLKQGLSRVRDCQQNQAVCHQQMEAQQNHVALLEKELQHHLSMATHKKDIQTVTTPPAVDREQLQRLHVTIETLRTSIQLLKSMTQQWLAFQANQKAPLPPPVSTDSDTYKAQIQHLVLSATQKQEALHRVSAELGALKEEHKAWQARLVTCNYPEERTRMQEEIKTLNQQLLQREGQWNQQQQEYIALRAEQTRLQTQLKQHEEQQAKREAEYKMLQEVAVQSSIQAGQIRQLEAAMQERTKQYELLLRTYEKLKHDYEMKVSQESKLQEEIKKAVSRESVDALFGDLKRCRAEQGSTQQKLLHVEQSSKLMEEQNAIQQKQLMVLLESAKQISALNARVQQDQNLRTRVQEVIAELRVPPAERKVGWQKRLQDITHDQEVSMREQASELLQSQERLRLLQNDPKDTSPTVVAQASVRPSSTPAPAQNQPGTRPVLPPSHPMNGGMTMAAPSTGPSPAEALRAKFLAMQEHTRRHLEKEQQFEYHRLQQRKNQAHQELNTLRATKYDQMLEHIKEAQGKKQPLGEAEILNRLQQMQLVTANAANVPAQTLLEASALLGKLEANARQARTERQRLSQEFARASAKELAQRAAQLPPPHPSMGPPGGPAAPSGGQPPGALTHGPLQPNQVAPLQQTAQVWSQAEVWRSMQQQAEMEKLRQAQMETEKTIQDIQEQEIKAGQILESLRKSNVPTEHSIMQQIQTDLEALQRERHQTQFDGRLIKREKSILEQQSELTTQQLQRYTKVLDEFLQRPDVTQVQRVQQATQEQVRMREQNILPPPLVHSTEIHSGVPLSNTIEEQARLGVHQIVNAGDFESMQNYLTEMKIHTDQFLRIPRKDTSIVVWNLYLSGRLQDIQPLVQPLLQVVEQAMSYYNPNTIQVALGQIKRGAQGLMVTQQNRSIPLNGQVYRSLLFTPRTPMLQGLRQMLTPPAASAASKTTLEPSTYEAPMRLFIILKDPTQALQPLWFICINRLMSDDIPEESADRPWMQLVSTPLLSKALVEIMKFEHADTTQPAGSPDFAQLIDSLQEHIKRWKVN